MYQKSIVYFIYLMASMHLVWLLAMFSINLSSIKYYAFLFFVFIFNMVLLFKLMTNARVLTILKFILSIIITFSFLALCGRLRVYTYMDLYDLALQELINNLKTTDSTLAVILKANFYVEKYPEDLTSLKTTTDMIPQIAYREFTEKLNFYISEGPYVEQEPQPLSKQHSVENLDITMSKSRIKEDQVPLSESNTNKKFILIGAGLIIVLSLSVYILNFV